MRLLIGAMLITIAHCADFDPMLTRIGSKGNPGCKMRFTTTGLGYVKEIGMRVINRQLSVLRFPTIKANIKPNGTVTITNMKTVQYWKPNEYQLDMEPSDEFSWTMVNMGIRTTGNFDGQMSAPVVGVPLKANGTFDALIPHMAFTLTIKLGKSSSGYPTVKVTRCKMYVDSVDLELKGGGLANLLNLMKGVLNNQLKPNIQNQVCGTVERLVDEDVNKMLSTLPLKVPLDTTAINVNKNRKKRAATLEYEDYYSGNDLGAQWGIDVALDQPKLVQINNNEYKQVNIRSTDFKDFINQIRSKDFILDLTLTHAPKIALGHAITEHVGEITYKGQNTPFNAPKMADITPAGKEMVQLYVSDYTANSLIYHAYKQKKLDIGIDADSSENLKKVLRTTCQSSFCIGDSLRNIANQFPDHYIDLTITPNMAPRVLIDKAGIHVHMTGDLNMYARKISDSGKGRLKVIGADVLLDATLTLFFSKNGQRIGGALKIDKLQLTKTYARLDSTTQFNLDELASLSKGMMESMADGVLQEGMPMPKLQGVEFVGPKMGFFDHFALVSSYFQIDEDYFNEKISSAVSKGKG